MNNVLDSIMNIHRAIPLSIPKINITGVLRTILNFFFEIKNSTTIPAYAIKDSE
jgi:hypothetical protein